MGRFSFIRLLESVRLALSVAFLTVGISMSMLLTSSQAIAVSFDYESQARTVNASSVLAGGQGDRANADDFGPFNESASTVASSARQRSSLDPRQIDIFLRTSSSDAASAQARFSVRFSLAEDTAFSLTGVVASLADFDQPFLRLRQIGVRDIYRSDVAFGTDEVIDLSGVLPAGTYLFTAAASAQAFVGSGNVTATLVIPEPSTNLTIGLGLAVLALGRRRFA